MFQCGNAPARFKSFTQLILNWCLALKKRKCKMLIQLQFTECVYTNTTVGCRLLQCFGCNFCGRESFLVFVPHLSLLFPLVQHSHCSCLVTLSWLKGWVDAWGLMPVCRLKCLIAYVVVVFLLLKECSHNNILSGDRSVFPSVCMIHQSLNSVMMFKLDDRLTSDLTLSCPQQGEGLLPCTQSENDWKKSQETIFTLVPLFLHFQKLAVWSVITKTRLCCWLVSNWRSVLHLSLRSQKDVLSAKNRIR